MGDAILPEGPTESYSRRGSSSELNIQWRDGQFRRHLSPGRSAPAAVRVGVTEVGVKSLGATPPFSHFQMEKQVGHWLTEAVPFQL